MKAKQGMLKRFVRAWLSLVKIFEADPYQAVFNLNTILAFL
jgi:hypothetical protein